VLALRRMSGSRTEWTETHRIVKFHGLLPASPGAPQGAVEFTAKEGGVRILGLHEIVRLI
jgi:hypothetical protein